MLIATFGPSTGWIGKTITYEDEQFVLEGHGPITAADVIEYERQGHLEFAEPQTLALTLLKARGYVVFPGDAAVVGQLVTQMVATIGMEYGFQYCYCQTGGAPRINDMGRKDRKRYEIVQRGFLEYVRHLRGLLAEAFRVFEENGSEAVGLWGFPDVMKYFEQVRHLLDLDADSDESLIRIEVDRMTDPDGGMTPKCPDMLTRPEEA